jgi:hypothetical protein
MNLEPYIERLVPDVSRARASAEALRTRNPSMTVVELANLAIRSAKLRAATAGAATGAASSPITMIPAAIADMVAVLAIEASLVAEIAALLDPGSLDDENGMKADIISVIFPAAASQALRQLGIRAGERVSQAALRKYASEDFVRSITRFAARYIGKKFTGEALVSKAVPLVGIGIGAGWNWLEVQAIGTRAIRYYSDDPIGPAPASIPLPSPKALLGKVRRFMPGRRRE